MRAVVNWWRIVVKREGNNTIAFHFNIHTEFFRILFNNNKKTYKTVVCCCSGCFFPLCISLFISINLVKIQYARFSNGKCGRGGEQIGAPAVLSSMSEHRVCLPTPLFGAFQINDIIFKGKIQSYLISKITRHSKAIQFV